MENKKNPKADLSKRSLLFFQLGLVAVLLTTYLVIEKKTYEKSDMNLALLSADDDDEDIDDEL